MRTGRRITDTVTSIVLVVAYFLAGKLGLHFATLNPSASAIWPPAGIALAVLLLLGHRVWPAIFVGAFLVNVTTAQKVDTSLGITVVTSLCIAVGNTLEAVMGAWMVNRFANGRNAFDRLQHVFRFVVLAAMVSTIISATIGVTTLAFARLVRVVDYDDVWLTWWLGDAVGDLVVAPLLLLWIAQPRLQLRREQRSEAVLLLLLLWVTGECVFGAMLPPEIRRYTLAYMCIPLPIWAAFRFGRRATTAIILGLAILAIRGTMGGYGPFANVRQNESLLLLQFFVGITAVMSLAVATVVSEREQSSESLRDRIRRLQLLKAFHESFQEAPDLKSVLQRVYEIVPHQLGVSRASILLYDEEREALVSDQWLGIQHPTEDLRSSPQPVGFSISGKCFAEGRPIVVQDCSQTELIPQQFVQQLNLKATVAVPIITQQKAIGVFRVDHCEKTHAFTETDVEFFSIVAEQLGMVIENTRLSEARRHAEQELRRAHDDLGIRVRQRTAELSQSNAALQAEVAAHQRAEEALRESEERYRRLVELSPDAIIVHCEGKIVFVNAAGAKLFGASTPEELISQSPLGFAHPDYLETAKGRMRQIIEEGETAPPLESKIIRLDGSAVEVEVAGAPISYQGQLAVQLVIRDITERKRADEALRASEERSRSIVDTAYDAFVGMDTAGRITEWNRQAEIIFGWPREEVLGQLLVETIIPLSYRPAHRRDLQHFLVTGEGPVLNRRIELPALHRNGHEFPAEMTIWPTCVGESYRFNAFARDLTAQHQAEEERKRAEEELRMSEQRFRELFANSPDAIFVEDYNGHVLDANSAACRLHEMQLEELVGKNVQDLVPAQLREQVARDFMKLVGGEWNHTEGFSVTREGRAVPVEITASRIEYSGRPALLLHVRDITLRKRAEEELQSLADELRRSNRELQEFAQVASHDLQEPLRKVQAFGDRLNIVAGTALNDQGRDYLQRMQDAAKRMQTLINDLLNFSRVTTRAQPFVPVDLATVTREVVSDLHARIEQTGGRVEVGNLPTIDADPTQMRQLLQNLISNGLKFHRETHSPMVKVCGRILANNDNGLCEIVVEDDGIGFDERHVDRIFTVFQRLHTRDEYEGTGMGLAICRKIVERHGGSIAATSALGGGARFIVTLPVNQSLT